MSVSRIDHLQITRVCFFKEAQQQFQNSFASCKQRMALLAKKLGSCVERARPFYEACKQAEEVNESHQFIVAKSSCFRPNWKLKKPLKNINDQWKCIVWPRKL